MFSRDEPQKRLTTLEGKVGNSVEKRKTPEAELCDAGLKSNSMSIGRRKLHTPTRKMLLLFFRLFWQKTSFAKVTRSGTS